MAFDYNLSGKGEFCFVDDRASYIDWTSILGHMSKFEAMGSTDRVTISGLSDSESLALSTSGTSLRACLG